MALTKGDLIAISEIVQGLEKKFETRFDGIDQRLDGIDQRLDGVEGRLDSVEERQRKFELIQENEVLPRLQNIEMCYLSTYKRYNEGISKIDMLEDDVNILKKVVQEHSEKLEKIS